MYANQREKALAQQLKGLMVAATDHRAGSWESDELLVEHLATSIARREANGTLTEDNVAADLLFGNRTSYWRNVKRIFGCNHRQLLRRAGVNNKGH